jgi:hypothetical protein
MKKRQAKKLDKQQKHAISGVLDKLIDLVKKKKVTVNELSRM